ncbi:hypothetical protein [Nocardia arthritidis]|uniref:Uncharacterized protein n=1 Tax=Nocardia arthritidis TaxID=228602 RepID=A0A6G9YHL3_9NOCA|nr:hypothetical protein [Nocardia arthritidis]QIS12547.1 hypothetical protein F5544_23440 [Nocardia arthritidis]
MKKRNIAIAGSILTAFCLPFSGAMHASAADLPVNNDYVVGTTDKLPADIQQKIGATSSPADTCGIGSPMNAQADGGGGWYVGWRNCWGQAKLKNGANAAIAPEWFNGGGDHWVNMRAIQDGSSMCMVVPNDGNVYWWHISAASLPGENTNFDNVSYCLAY